MIAAPMPCVWHLRVHQWDGEDDFVLSLDFQKHMDNLPEQADIIDMLLEMPAPLPLPPPPPTAPSPPAKPEASEGGEDGAFGDLAALLAHRPDSPVDALKAPVRVRHNLLTDALIYKYVAVNGPKWRALARSLGGRAAGYSDDVVRNRYIRILDALGTPYVSQTPHNAGRDRPSKRSSRWTPEEDGRVRAYVQGSGASWTDLQRESLPDRTAHAVRNRATRLGLTGIPV